MEIEQFKELLNLLGNLGDGAFDGFIVWVMLIALEYLLTSGTIIFIVYSICKLIKYSIDEQE